MYLVNWFASPYSCILCPNALFICKFEPNELNVSREKLVILRYCSGIPKWIYLPTNFHLDSFECRYFVLTDSKTKNVPWPQKSCISYIRDSLLWPLSSIPPCLFSALPAPLAAEYLNQVWSANPSEWCGRQREV